MIPVRDSIRSRRFPLITVTIIALNIAVFIHQSNLTPGALRLFFLRHGIVPVQFMMLPRFLFSGRLDVVYHLLGTLVTGMFIHGNLVHLLGNMLYLWVFGDNIEDVMGPWRFLVFYVCCGLAALGVHFAFNMHSTLPVVGASGAIAGVMGAYFLLYPHAKVVTLIPIIIIPFIVELPAVLFLGIWFVTQFFSGFSEAVSARTGTIAWWAHAGGFVAGMLLLPIFRRSDRCYYCYGKDQGRPQGPAS